MPYCRSRGRTARCMSGHGRVMTELRHIPPYSALAIGARNPRGRHFVFQVREERPRGD